MFFRHAAIQLAKESRRLIEATLAEMTTAAEEVHQVGAALSAPRVPEGNIIVIDDDDNGDSGDGDRDNSEVIIAIGTMI